MKKYLLIAEKPSAMKEYQSVYKKHESEITSHLGASIDFTALHGHIFRDLEPKEYEIWKKKWVDLYNNDIPLIPDKWDVAPIDNSKKLIADLKTKLASGYDGIIVGTDSDIEGYGIYYRICCALNLKSWPTLRFYETALTEKDILASFLSMEDLYTTPRHRNAIKAYIFRNRWDWLIGMNFTIAYTVRYGQLMKVGSVKAPTLKLIYDNCYAIDNFTENYSYGVRSDYKEGFSGTLLDEDKKEQLYLSETDAKNKATTLGATATVLSYETKRHTQKAPKLYALSDLQVDASKLGYTPEETLAIAQKLYEAKILTYPRTSGRYLSSGKASELPGILNSMKVVPDINKFITGISSSDISRASSDSNFINDKEVAKAAHDALILTGQSFSWDKLSDSEKEILLLVCKRFVAHFLPMFSEDKITMLSENNGNVLKSTGRITIVNGFNEIYGKTVTDVILPVHKKGDILEVVSSDTYKKTTTPPKRYSTGTIIQAMTNIANQVTDVELKKIMKESEGIGTEATRANILKDLESSGYVDVRKNLLYITEAGKAYIENLRFPREDDGFDYGIADPVKVAYWSAKAKNIQLGEGTISENLDELYDYLNETIGKIRASGSPIQTFGNKVDENRPSCPVCGGKLISGKYGWFCENRKDNCKFSVANEIAGKKLTDGQKAGLVSGKTIKVKGMKSKAGKTFDAGVRMIMETGKLEFVFK